MGYVRRVRGQTGVDSVYIREQKTGGSIVWLIALQTKVLQEGRT